MKIMNYWVLLVVISGFCISQIFMFKTYAKELSKSSSETSHRQIYTQKPKNYVGSKKCLKCHLQHYQGWETTLHTKMEQPVILKGPDKTVKGDFSSNDPVLTFKLEDADIVVGSRFKQRYSRKIGDDWSSTATKSP